MHPGIVARLDQSLAIVGLELQELRGAGTGHRLGAGREFRGECAAGQFGTVKFAIMPSRNGPGVGLRRAHIYSQSGFVGDGEEWRGTGRSHQHQRTHIHRAAGDDAVERRPPDV